MNSQAMNPPRILILALAFLGFAFGGCTQVQLAPDIQGEFALGELQVLVDENFADSYNAAKRAIADLDLFQTMDDRKVVEAELRARDTTDTIVTIKIKELGPDRTSIKIRYGLPGSLPPAQDVYRAIERRL